MKLLILSLLLLLVSCEDDKKGETLSGFNLEGLQDSCVLPEDLASHACPAIYSSVQDLYANFKLFCEAEGGQVLDCQACNGENLCSKSLDILVSGYSRDGFFFSSIPRLVNNYCTSSMDLGDSKAVEELYRDNCEARGHTATLVGCDFLSYICSEKI